MKEGERREARGKEHFARRRDEEVHPLEPIAHETRIQMRVLVDSVAPLWAGEAEITRSYFEGDGRSPESDLFWLRAQAFKETRHLRDLPAEIQREYRETGSVAVHPDGEGAGKILREEMKHYRLLADLIEKLDGSPVVIDALGGLEEDRKLQALRARYREQGGELARATVTFTEGGGGSMYSVLSSLGESELDRGIAAAFREIHADEVIHGPMQVFRIARRARSDQDWARCREMAVAICRQRLRMRSEMFGWPLSELRLHEIESGKIEAWPIPIEI